MKKILFSIFFLSISLITSAQYKVSGKVTNKQTGEIVEMATVRLFSYKGNDSTLVQGAQADFDGRFVLEGIKNGQYKIYISSIGYKEVSQSVKVNGQDVRLKTFRLDDNVQHLAEVEVVGKAAEMVVKGDTLEYNTAAYKTQETDMVEDLLKKMNGVEIDSEGKVTINGEEITAIRIDGKKFFGDDVQAATKNIPADMIEKIQVIDEKSDMAKLTGFEDDDTQRIINLQLKPDKKKGMFANFNGGLGADFVADNGNWFDYNKNFFSEDFRYNASAFMNILYGESQTTILANANNTNELRTGRGRGGWGGQTAGITWAENLGVNTNIVGKSGYLYGGDMQFNHSINRTQTKSEKEQWTDDYSYQQNDSSARRTDTWDVKTRLEFEFEIDSMNKVILKPEISYTNSLTNSYKDYNYRRDEDITTIGWQDNITLSNQISAKAELIYNHKFIKPGRTLTVNGNFSFSNTVSDSHNWSENTSFTDSPINNINQWTDKTQNTFRYVVRASYVEPIYKTNHFLETVIRFEQNNRWSDKYQYQDSLRTIIDSTYTNTLNNNFFSESVELNYKWVDKAFDLTVGLRANPSQTLSYTHYGNGFIRDTLVSVFNIAPNAMFKYNFGKKEFARIRYRGTSEQPTINQMEPVKDNSNAMNETVGNLSLKPAFRHRINFMYSRYNEERFSSMTAGLFANITKDALVNNSIYDETGKLYQQTVNANGTPYSIYAHYMYNTPFANKLLQFHTRTGFGYNVRLAYVSRENSIEKIERLLESNSWDLDDESESRTGNLTVNEDLTLRLTHNMVDAGLRATFNYSYTHNNLTNNPSNVFRWSITGDVVLRLPLNWEIATDIGYTDRIGYGRELGNLSEIMWNLSLSKTWAFGTLTIKANDILNQKKNIVQTVGENYVQYQKFNTLPTYGMITFTYKLNRMGDLKAKGEAAYMQQMVEGSNKPGGGNRPPQGPPPTR